MATKATKLKSDVHLNRRVSGALLFPGGSVIGPTVDPTAAPAAAALSSCACCSIQSACFDVGGSNGSPLSHFSRARDNSPAASSAFASAARRSNSSEWTSAWHWSHTSAPGASSCEQRLQLRISSGAVVDTAGLSDSKRRLVPHALFSRNRRLRQAPR